MAKIRPEFTGPPPVVPPLDPISLIIDIVSFIVSLFGFGKVDLQPLATAINTTWNNMVVGTFFLYNAIGAITNFLWKVLGTIAAALSHILSDILHGHLKAVLEDIQKLLHALHNLFAPLLAWLHKLQAMQRQMQLQAMRRLINLIQRARQILVVFRLLHLKFAQKLDNWLAGIEGKIITRELEIARKTNEVIAWVNFVADPFGALRGAAVFGPIGRLLQALAGAARAVDLQRVFPALRSTPGPNGSTVVWSRFTTTYEAERAGTTGELGAFHGGVLKVRALLDQEYDT